MVGHTYTMPQSIGNGLQRSVSLLIYDYNVAILMPPNHHRPTFCYWCWCIILISLYWTHQDKKNALLLRGKLNEYIKMVAKYYSSRIFKGDHRLKWKCNMGECTMLIYSVRKTSGAKDHGQFNMYPWEWKQWFFK